MSSVSASPTSSPRLGPTPSLGLPSTPARSPPVPTNLPSSSASASSTSTSRRILRGHARSTSRDMSSSSAATAPASTPSSSFLVPPARLSSHLAAQPPPTAAQLAHVLLIPSPDSSLYSDAHLALNMRPVSGFMNVGLWADPFSPPSSPTSASLPCDLTTAGQSLVRLVAEFGNLRGKRVLDVGYGLGDSSLLLHAEFGCDVVGITYSAQQAAIAQLRAHRLGLAANPTGAGAGGVHMHQGDAARLEHEWRSKLDATPVDAIVSIDSAYHYQPRSAFFAQAFNVLSSHTHATYPAIRPPLSPPAAPSSPTDTGSPPPSRHRSRTPSASSSTSSTSPPRPLLLTVDLIVPNTRLGRWAARVAHIPPANLGNILDYERQVTRAGFVHVEMVDVSHAVFPGLTRYLTSAAAGVKWKVAGWVWWAMWRLIGVQCVLVRGQVPPPNVF